MARICRLYGVSPLLGRLYALLFLAASPVSLDELSERAGAAKSTVSVALRKLLSLRLVRRLPPRSDRRDFYEVVADPWSVLEDWTRLFFEPELEMWSTSGDELERALAHAPDAPAGADGEKLKHRLEELRGFIDVFAELLTKARPRARGSASRAIPIDIEESE